MCGNVQNELWRIDDEHPNYMVSNIGRVMNIKRNKIMKLSENKNGYLQVTLWHNGQGKTEQAAYFVARAFIPNPMFLPSIDHINRDRLDNRVENLRWASYSQQGANRSYPNSCGVRGVRQRGQKWRAQIKFNGKICSLGSYNTKEQAGLIYDTFAWMLYRDFAILEPGIQRVYTEALKIKIVSLFEHHQFKF